MKIGDVTMLLASIEKKRKQMIEAAQTHGLSSNQVLKYSQELDKMIDLYQTQTKKRDFRPKKKLILFKNYGNDLKIQILKKAQ